MCIALERIYMWISYALQFIECTAFQLLILPFTQQSVLCAVMKGLSYKLRLWGFKYINYSVSHYISYKDWLLFLPDWWPFYSQSLVLVRFAHILNPFETINELKANTNHAKPSSTYGVKICKRPHFYKHFLLARLRCEGTYHHSRAFNMQRGTIWSHLSIY